jgi:uncharacterized protein (TIGR03643 family)
MKTYRPLKSRFKAFSAEEKEEIIRLACKEKVSYEEIYQRFGLTPGHLVAYMSYILPKFCFKQWRRRLYQNHPGPGMKTGVKVGPKTYLS